MMALQLWESNEEIDKMVDFFFRHFHTYLQEMLPEVEIPEKLSASSDWVYRDVNEDRVKINEIIDCLSHIKQNIGKI